MYNSSVHLFYLASGMEVSSLKSYLLYNEVEEGVIQKVLEIFLVQMNILYNGFTYLGYFLKPNCYYTKDWFWLLRKIENKIRLYMQVRYQFK